MYIKYMYGNYKNDTTGKAVSNLFLKELHWFCI